MRLAAGHHEMEPTLVECPGFSPLNIGHIRDGELVLPHLAVWVNEADDITVELSSDLELVRRNEHLGRLRIDSNPAQYTRGIRGNAGGHQRTWTTISWLGCRRASMRRLIAAESAHDVVIGLAVDSSARVPRACRSDEAGWRGLDDRRDSPIDVQWSPQGPLPYSSRHVAGMLRASSRSCTTETVPGLANLGRLLDGAVLGSPWKRRSGDRK